MSGRRATYLDSSALVKLAVREPESDALRAYVRRGRTLVSSALSRTEVARALLPLDAEAGQRGQAVLDRVELHRVNDRVLKAAGALQPPTLRSLDAIHLATARQFGGALSAIVTYDPRMADAARELGLKVVQPA